MPEKSKKLEIPFTGSLQLSDDPLLVEPDGYSELKNMRYTDKSIKGVNGYSKINTLPLHSLYDYTDFTETDAPGRATVAAHIITVSDLDTDEEVSVHKDEGASYFDGDIQQTGSFMCENLSTGKCGLWALTNNIDRLYGLADGDLDHLALRCDVTDGNDSYTRLLLHFIGLNGGEVFTDHSASPHSLSKGGHPYTDTSNYKFGSSSGYFDGDDDYLYIADSGDWYNGTNKVTIDFWVRLKNASRTHGFFNQTDALNDRVYFEYNHDLGKLFFTIMSGGTSIILAGDWEPEANTWYHIAVIRGWGGDENSWALCVDGVPLDTTADGNQWPDFDGDLEIGKSTSSHYLYGWLDELRWTKGTARWTADFSGSLPSKRYGAPYLILQETNGATDTTDSSVCLDPNETYYWKIIRDESVGTFGELSCEVSLYEDFRSSVLELSVTLTEKQDFQHIFGMISYDGASGGNAWSGYISNLVGDIYDIQSGYHFKKDLPSESHVVLQSINSTGDSKLFLNDTAIPDQGDFEDEALYSDPSGASRGRFASAPQGNMTYCNGLRSMIWGGDELRCAAFIASTTTIANTVTNARDYTDQIQNRLDSSDEVASIGGSYTDWVIGATRPLKGVKFYVKTPNDTVSTLTAKQWDGTAWQALAITNNTISGAKSLAQTGTVTWADTDGTSVAKYLEGRILYWYQFNLSAGSATLYHVTVDAALQTIKNIWGGDSSVVAACKFYDGSDYQDYTVEVNDAITSTAMHIGGFTTTQYMYLGFTVPQQGFELFIPPERGNIVASTLTVSYWDGDSWVAVSGLSDGTSDGSNALAHSGVISFTAPTRGTEFPKSFNQEGPYYYYRLSISASIRGRMSGDTFAFVESTPPTITDSGSHFLDVGGFSAGSSLEVINHASNDGTYTIASVNDGTITLSSSDAISAAGTGDDCILLAIEEVQVYYVQGIEAPKKIPAHKFAVHFQNRVLLCSPDEAPEAMLVSAENAPDVYNGDDSTTLYFGGHDDLVAGIGLYNRFGASIYNFAVLCKKTETWILNGYSPDTFEKFTLSTNIGCCAPFTMDSCEIGYKITKEMIRNIAMWLSYDGPVLCDGGVLMPIKGLEPYFDINDSRCINYDAIDISVGRFDPLRKEYNLLIPSGSGQTTINKWFVYDLVRSKWFEKVPPVYPQCMFQVEDVNGAKYCYVGFDHGYIELNEDGTTFDGTAIDQSVTLGDKFLTTSMWDKTRLDYLKLICVARNTGDQEVITVKHRVDGSQTWTTLEDVPMYESGKRYVSSVQRVNKAGISHELHLECSTDDKTDGMELLALGLLYSLVRLDIQQR